MRRVAVFCFAVLALSFFGGIAAQAGEYNALCDRNNSNFYGFYGKNTAELTCVASWAGRLAVKNQDLQAENQRLRSENQKLRKEVAGLIAENAALNEKEKQLLYSDLPQANKIFSGAAMADAGKADSALNKSRNLDAVDVFIIFAAILLVIAVLNFALEFRNQRLAESYRSWVKRMIMEKREIKTECGELVAKVQNQAVQLAELRLRLNKAEFKGVEYEIHNEGVAVRQKENLGSCCEMFLICKEHAGGQIKPKNMVLHLSEAHGFSDAPDSQAGAPPVISNNQQFSNNVKM